MIFKNAHHYDGSQDYNHEQSISSQKDLINLESESEGHKID